MKLLVIFPWSNCLFLENLVRHMWISAIRSIAILLTTLACAHSQQAFAGQAKTEYVEGPPGHIHIYQWMDTERDAREACAIFANPHALVCGGSGGGEGQGELNAGWWNNVYMTWYYCLDGYSWDEDVKRCRRAQSIYAVSAPLMSCPAIAAFGNPIEPLNNRKTQKIDLGVGVAGMDFSIRYDSLRGQIARASGISTDERGANPAIGGDWSANWSAGIYRSPTQSNGNYLLQYFGDTGDMRIFVGPTMTPGSTFVDKYANDATVSIVDEYETMMLKDAATGAIAIFSRATPQRFSLSQLWRIDGQRIFFRLSDPADRLYIDGQMINGMPKSLQDGFGRTVRFDYETRPSGGYVLTSARVVKMYTPAGDVSLGYTADGFLNKLSWPDGTEQNLVVGNSSSGIGPLLLGVIDESGVRYSTFGYDQDGNVISTEHAGGVMAYSSTATARARIENAFEYNSTTGAFVRTFAMTPPSGVSVTGPRGESITLESKRIGGLNVPIAKSQPAGSGCAESMSRQDFDERGNLTWREDFSGYRTCFSVDPVRNMGVSRVEGLARGTACEPLLVAGASLPTGARKTTSAWHPTWRLETRVAEPRRVTTKVYNGQPDPFAGGAPASCAPGNATLPDGSPIVVLCKQVEQATSDTNGSQGLAALVDAAVPARVQRWTYNEFGQVLTYTDPLNNVTTNTYYADTTADHTRGDLYTVANAKNHVVTFTRYNATGQWLEMKDANDVITTRTFDLRQRIKTIKTGTAQTSYDYWPTGLLKQVTLPDNSSVSYVYDDAHRLTSITDNLGNSVTYVLDNSGNRISEEVKDAGGNLAKTLSLMPDALNRIQQVAGRP